MSDFMLEKIGGNGLYAVFHQDAGQGFFFLYRSEANEVLAQAQVYDSEPNPPITEQDVEIIWSTSTNAFLSIHGKTVCRIDAMNLLAECMVSEKNLPEKHIEETEVFDSFEPSFKNARQRYWKEKADR